MNSELVRDKILTLESDAMQLWCKGDPSGFLEIVADDVTYFDPFLNQRINGRAALTAYYESFRGQVNTDSYEFVSPVVQCYGDVAVLTFLFNSREKQGSESHWNCTEVYRLIGENWRIVQTHWSFTGIGAATSNA